MKNNMYFLILLSLFPCIGCVKTHSPQIIIDNIETIENKNLSTFKLNLGEAFGINYDYLYIFNSSVPISGIRNIIGIDQFYSRMNSEKQLGGYDGEHTILILVKDNIVMYEDVFNSREYGLIIDYESFEKIWGEAIFDGKKIKVPGYRLSSQEVCVRCVGNKYEIFYSSKDIDS